jgi:hypothetical protein
MMERLVEIARKAIPILVALALIPIVLHLWLGMLDYFGLDDVRIHYWELINIGNDVP